jgi:hypothetical protein
MNTAVLQKAHDFRCLISCNPTGHAQRNFHSRRTAATASKPSPAYRIDAATWREMQSARWRLVFAAAETQ